MISENYKNELFGLVKSLNATEKAYLFKLSKRHSGKNNSLHLQFLNILFKSNEYNETVFKGTLNVKSAAQFSMIKKYLFNEIIDTLIFLYRHQNNFTESDKHIMILELLIDRKLFKSAGKIINREKETATRSQNLIKKLRLLKIEFELLRFTNPGFLGEQNKLINSQFKEVETAEKLSIQFRELIVLRNASNNRIDESEFKDAKHVLQYVSAFQLNAETSPITQILFSACNALACHLATDSGKSAYYNNQVLNIWNNYPSLVSHHSVLFIECATTALHNSFSFNDIQKAIAVFKSFKSLSMRLENRTHIKRWQLFEFNTMLKIYHKSGNYNKVRELLFNEGKAIEKLSSQILPPPEYLALLASIVISYFVLDDLKSADSLMYKVKSLLSSSQRQDIFYFAQVFHLLIIYELGDNFRLHNAAETAYQQLYKKRALRPFEKDIMSLIKSLSSSSSKTQTQKQMVEALRKLDEYKNDPVKKMHFLYFNYHGWLQSKIMDTPYRNYVMANLKKQINDPD